MYCSQCGAPYDEADFARCPYCSGLMQRMQQTESLASAAEVSEAAVRAAETQALVSEYDLYKLQLLKGKITSIIGRLIASILLGMLVGKDPRFVLVWYILVSYCWLFIKATGNYLIGLIATVLAFVIGFSKLEQITPEHASMYEALFLLGVFVIDGINLLRYLLLKAKVTKNGMAIRRLSRQEMKAYRKAKKS